MSYFSNRLDETPGGGIENMVQMERHELSAVFPDMDDHEFSDLTDDVKAHGLAEPIVVYKDKVLDGWHRYKACLAAGREPRFKPLSSTKDPVDWVLTRNLHRRHLMPAQRTACVLMARAWRNGAGRPTKGEARDARERPDAPDRKMSTPEIAKEAGVHVNTVKGVKAGIRKGYGEQLIEGTITPHGIEKKEAEKAGKPKPLTRVQKLSARVKELEAEVRRLRDQLKAEREAHQYTRERAGPPDGKDRLIAGYQSRNASLVAQNGDLTRRNNRLVEKLKGYG